ncbi:unnamed protein product [Cylicocyclus nassatus]|uniref:Uncharacterized protein n=1 Tax=Cylicocyclus nassatus TaxID=53992 RepID=A0AA36HCJ6_CYLNA|nr:unnamed protein product [Cylicocyclus nassatus]
MVIEKMASRSSRSNIHNAILFSALQIYTSIDHELVEHCFETFQVTQKFICITHSVNAAQYLLAEMMARGVSLSRTTEGKSYLLETEIPADIPDLLNETIRTFSEAREEVHASELLGQPMDVASQAPGGQEEPGSEKLSSSLFVSPEKQLSKETESPAKTSSSSYQISPEKQPSTSGSEDTRPRKKTEEKDLNKYFLVPGKKLLELFHLSRCECSENASTEGVWLKGFASAPVIYYTTAGSTTETRRWEGQDRLGPTLHEKVFIGNVISCVANVTTGTRISKQLQWAKEVNVALPGKTTFYDMFEEMRPVIKYVYDKREELVIQEIESIYEAEGQPRAWDIAVDGAYNSRGHTAAFCKLLAVDLKTNLCVHTEVLHRSETGGVSGRMEKEGFRRLLRWFHSRNITLRSVSTDRSAMYGNEIRQFNSDFNTDIQWYLDPWHINKRIHNHLRPIIRLRDCTNLKDWISPLKAHLYHAVREGARAQNAQLTRHIFNTCLYHLAGIHEWNQDVNTGPITRCDHQEWPQGQKPIIALGSQAHEKLKALVLQKELQEDLARMSPFGGTSQCESKNALDRVYCPKEIYLPITTYPTYVMLSTLHMNELRLAEMRGERIVERSTTTIRKYSDIPKEIPYKTPVEHIWRKEILVEYMSLRSGRSESSTDQPSTSGQPTPAPPSTSGQESDVPSSAREGSDED